VRSPGEMAASFAQRFAANARTTNRLSFIPALGRPSASASLMERIARSMLLLGGGMSVAMALYHFFLPVQFHWAKSVGEIRPILQSSLFALNYFFSYLLLVVGAAVLAAGWNPLRNELPLRHWGGFKSIGKRTYSSVYPKMVDRVPCPSALRGHANPFDVRRHAHSGVQTGGVQTGTP
jgi:hypothetical protein